jgi:hypothetical protein
LKIPKGQSESVYRKRTDNTMTERKRTKGQEEVVSVIVLSVLRYTDSDCPFGIFKLFLSSFCPFSFGHCVICSFSIYGFWLKNR